MQANAQNGGTKFYGPAILAITAPFIGWVLLLLIVPPRDQDFPLHDDALFSRTAIGFARGGGLHYYNRASMPLVGQLIWTTPFLWVFGESHVTLRLAVIVLACLGVGAFHDLLRREVRVPLRRAAFVAACLGLNPLFCLLTNTFHTDVPALAFSLLALAIYARGLSSGGPGWWAAAALVAILAVTTRQNAITAPLAAGILLSRRTDLRRHIGCWFSVFLPLGMGLLTHFWFMKRTDVWHFAPQFPSLVSLPVIAFIGLHLLGLASLPVLTLPAKRSWRAFIVALSILLVAANLLFTVKAGMSRGLFPYLGNWITPWGQFEENSIIPGERPVLVGFGLRLALTLAGCLAGAALVARLVAKRQEGAPLGMLGLFSLLHLPFLVIAPSVYDRYLLVLLPGALALGGTAACNRGIGIVRVGLLATLAFLAFALTQDFFAWNRALWALGRRTEARGVPATDIAGGLAWDGWHAPDAAAEKKNRPPCGLVPAFTRRFFPHVTGRYAISFSILPGTRAIDSEPYRPWLIHGEHRMFLLEAESSTPQLSPSDSTTTNSRDDP